MPTANFDRNQGIVTQAEQARLTDSRVAVLGLGGLGGVIVEVLARSGISAFSLVDFDRFDKTNLNRQIFAFTDTVGQPKLEVTRDQLLRINPDLDLRLDATLNEGNTDHLLHGCDAVVLAADDVVPCILAARYCRTANIPLIEGWAIPFCNARVFTADTPTLEACYGLTDIPEPVSAMSAEQRKAMTEAMIMTVARIEGVVENYAPDILERLQAGQIPSFAPMVWFAAVRMSIEVIKVLLGRGRLALAPEFAVYDPFLHRIAQQV